MNFFNNHLMQALGMELPIWQAPLPFDLIPADMSGQISAAGAIGVIRIAEHHNIQTLEYFTQEYKKHHPQPIYSFAHRLPQILYQTPKNNDAAITALYRHFSQDTNIPQNSFFLDLLDFCLQQNPRAIGFAHGIPDREMIAVIQENNILTFAICRNILEVLAADDFGIDFFILQGNEAGGERAGFTNSLPEICQSALSLLQQVRSKINKPFIVWGDFSEGDDVIAAMLSGASGVMIDRGFLACTEAQLPESMRKKAIYAHEFDSEINTQFTARPMRCFSCDSVKIPEAIGAEGLWEQVLTRKTRPLPLSLSPIQDPINLQALFERYMEQIKKFLA